MPDTAARPAGSTLALRELTTPAEVEALAPAWERLLAEAETSSPFLTPEWVRTWWECLGQAAEPWVLVLEDELGPAAIAPFARTVRRLGPLTYRVVELAGTGPLRFLGMGLADRADLLLARRREECARRILERLAGERARFEVIDLRFLPRDSTTARVFAAEARGAGLGLSSEPLAESPFLPLHGTFAEYVARRGSSFRKGLKRKLARLEAMGEVGFVAGAGDGDASQAIAAAVEVSLASWKEQEGSALLLHENVRSFFEALLPRLQAHRRIYLSLLTVAGKLAAHELGFRLDRKLWSYDSAFKRAFAAGSPGVLLTARVLEAAFAEGLAEYDFMRGNEGYKTAWAAETRSELQLVLDTGTARARAARTAAFEARWALKRRPALVRLQGRLVGAINRAINRAIAGRRSGR